MVIRPWVVVYPVVNLRVGVAGAFCAKLPYCPVDAMLVVEELDEGVSGIAVCSLGVCRGGTGGGDDYQAQRSSGRL